MPDRLSHVNFDHKHYAEKNLVEDHRVAYMNVLLCVVAVAEVSRNNARLKWVDENEMHEHYPVFGRIMDMPESFLQKVGYKCKAVSIFYREENLQDRDNVRWVPIYLAAFRKEYGDVLKYHPERERVLVAAREVCKAIFPSWDWDPVTV